MALTAAQKLTKARADLIMGHPFFGSLALRLKLKEDSSLETAGCDGETLIYNPKFVEGLSMSKVVGLVAHEVMHPAFMHHTRRGDRDPEGWNMACDYAINGLLLDSGFDLPNGGCVNPTYKGMTAEHIYSLLPKEEKSKQGSGMGNAPDSSGNDGEGASSPQDPGGDGGVNDSPNSTNKGASQSQQDAEEADWKIAVTQAAHVAKQQGRLPAGMERLISDLLDPILPWRSILRRFMTEKCNDDFSWARGNRRFIAQGLYLPSRRSDDAMGEMVVIIDTSGSVDDQQLQEFGSEIASIVKEARPSKTVVVYCDAAVQHVDEFAPDDELVFTVHGGGGTDFCPPFRMIEDKNMSPRAVVYLTDGYGAFPEEEPPYPTLWAINNHDVVPPFGEHLVIA